MNLIENATLTNGTVAAVMIVVNTADCRLVIFNIKMPATKLRQKTKSISKNFTEIGCNLP